MNTGRKNDLFRLALSLGMVILCGSFVPARAVSTVTKTDGTVLQVKACRWIESSSSFAIVKMDGSTLQLEKSLVDKIDMDKPAKYALAEEQISGKQYDAAIQSLDSVMTEYQKQGWDVDAACRIAELYLTKKNDPRRAAQALEKAVAGVPKSEITAQTQMMLWTCQLAQGADKTPALRKELDDAITGGQRDLAAAAYVVRGGLNRLAGQRESAVLDYLRVVIMFDNVKSVQPEALFRASQMLDEMKDPGGRGDVLRRKLLELYPDSAYADEARKKLG
ncbi:MAG: hypothetical protein WCP86_07680 [bacterium]